MAPRRNLFTVSSSATGASPRDGRYIEQVGTYDPSASTGGVKLNREKIDAWIKKGAKPSQTVSELIKKEKKAS